MQGKYHDVYAGRAVFQVPAGVELKLSSSQVGQVRLERVVAADKPFETLWSERLALLRSGRGERYGTPVVMREFSGAHTVLFDTTGRPGTGGTLEHWQQFAGAILKGQTDVSQDEIGDGIGALKEVFESIHVGQTPGSGDFAFDGGFAHLQEHGAETIDADWVETIPLGEAEAMVKVKFTFSTVAVAAPGRAEVLENLKGLRVTALAHGVRLAILREGNRTAAGMDGEESIVTFANPTHAGPTSYTAQWQSVGVAHEARKPATQIRADIDLPASKDSTAISAAWDALVRSIHFQ